MNWQVFRTRSLTALIFVVVMMGGLLWNRWSFFALFTLVHFGCWMEYQKLALAISPAYKETSTLHRLFTPILGWALVLYLAGPAFRLGDLLPSSLAAWLAIPLVIALPVSDLLLVKNIRPVQYAWSLGGLLYISLPLGLLLNMRSFGITGEASGTDWGRYWPCVVIFSLWVNDTMAYVSGSFIGKTPFSKISPKKTWEGTIGGVLLCVLAMHFLGPYLFDHAAHSSRFVFAVALLSAVTGTAGDLFESWLKRRAGVKDSGRIMPGHGGFLDRFDSLLFAAPFAWLLLQLLF